MDKVFRAADKDIYGAYCYLSKISRDPRFDNDRTGDLMDDLWTRMGKEGREGAREFIKGLNERGFFE